MMDRRVKRTRRAIFDALVELLAQEPIAQITVGAIARRADVNRVTVYQHFSDKYDLLDQCARDYVSRLLEDCSHGPGKELLLRAFRFVDDNRLAFRTLAGATGGGVFRDELHAEFRRRAESRIEGEGLRHEIAAEALASALSGVVSWWIAAPDGISAEEACGACLDIAERLGLGFEDD